MLFVCDWRARHCTDKLLAGEWMDVPTLPGLFVFNVADMLAR